MSRDERAKAMTKDEIVLLLVTHEQLEQQRDDLKRQLDWLSSSCSARSPSADYSTLVAVN